MAPIALPLGLLAGSALAYVARTLLGRPDAAPAPPASAPAPELSLAAKPAPAPTAAPAPPTTAAKLPASAPTDVAKATRFDADQARLVCEAKGSDTQIAGLPPLPDLGTARSDTGDAIPADIAAALSLAASTVFPDRGADIAVGLPPMDDTGADAGWDLAAKTTMAAAAPLAAIPVVGPIAAAATAIGGGIMKLINDAQGPSEAEIKAAKMKAAKAEEAKVKKVCSPCEKKRKAAEASLKAAQQARREADAARDTATQRGAVSDTQAQVDRAAIEAFNASLPHWPWKSVKVPSVPTLPGPMPAPPAVPADR